MYKIGETFINLDSKVMFLIEYIGMNAGSPFYGVRNLETDTYYEFRQSSIEHENNRKYLPYILSKL